MKTDEARPAARFITETPGLQQISDLSPGTGADLVLVEMLEDVGNRRSSSDLQTGVQFSVGRRSW